MKILYEDNHCIAVWKPAGISTQGDGNHNDFTDILKQFLKMRDMKTGNIFLAPVHRIDRYVEGVLLFAKTSKGASRLNEQLRNNTVKKTYRAILEGNIQYGTYYVSGLHKKLPHRADVKNVILSKSDIPTDSQAHLYSGYTIAKHTCKVLSHLINNTLVEIYLHTGKYHQIRALSAYSKHPIVGDVLYGSKIETPFKHICLAAIRLEFTPPTKQNSVVIEYIPPHFNKK